MRFQRRSRTAFLGWVGLYATCCVGRSQAAEKSAHNEGQPVTLNVWIMRNAPKDNESTFLSLVRPFAKENPQIKVAVTVLPWSEAWDRIRRAVNGGPAPDIVQLGTTWVAPAASTGKLLELTGKYEERLFPPDVLSTTVVADQAGAKVKRFAMPWIVDARALYYNKAACAMAGIDPKKDFATWDSFKAALEKLKVKVGGKRMQPLALSINSYDGIHSLSWWIWGWGGGFVSRNSEEAGINSQGSIAGLEYAIGLVREGLMLVENNKQSVLGIADMLDRGEVAMTMAFPIPWLSPERFGIALLPAGPRGRFTFLGGSALAILESSKHQKEALALIKFLSDPAVQFSYSNLTGYLPAASAEYDELVLQLDPVRKVFVEQMRYGRAYPSISQWGAIENILRDGFDHLWKIALRPGPYNPTAVRNQLDDMSKSIDGALHAPSGRRSAQ
jgi:multiple sugar transport system substrate-binding protein